MKEIYYWTATQMIQAMQSGQVSAVEVMQAHLDRIRTVNPSINALVQQVPEDMCLKQARAADEKMARKEKLGKLHGLPVTFKDKHLVKGLISCVGCTAFKDKVAQEDSTVVTFLKNEGAIVVGITNVPEMLSSYETDNLVYGRTNNPYDLSKTPGGSSGGCSALVAAGCIPLSIGSDAAGSLRWPAHCTGIVAHKPTIGLVSRAGSPMGNGLGMLAYFATSGPMTRSVADATLALSCLCGVDGIDPFLAPVPLKDPYAVDVKSLRVAYVVEDGISHISSDVRQTLQNAVHTLKPHVAKIDLVPIDCFKKSYRMLWENFYLGGDGGQGVKEMLTKLGVKEPSPLMQAFLKQAEKSSLTLTQFKNLFREITLYRIELLQTLKEYDILITPVAATAAKAHGTTHRESQDMTHSMVHSLSSWPVTTVRCGVTSEGLPIGLQIAAKPWEDHLALAIAAVLESLCGGWQPTQVDFFKPQLF